MNRNPYIHFNVFVTSLYLEDNYLPHSYLLREERFSKINKIVRELKSQEKTVKSPISEIHPDSICAILPGCAYLKHLSDSHYIKYCDLLSVIMLDGWKTSLYIQEDVNLAISLGIPVEYVE